MLDRLHVLMMTFHEIYWYVKATSVVREISDFVLWAMAELTGLHTLGVSCATMKDKKQIDFYFAQVSC